MVKYRDENGKFISKAAWEKMQNETDKEHIVTGKVIAIGLLIGLVALYVINNLW